MKQFKTESKKLLDLMINSIYTNKEIFLRELVSNASDAIDKLSFESLTNPDVHVDQDSLAIRLAFDKDVRTITVSDNGIGMTKDELDKNLGTIAHSGSEAFKEANAEHQGQDMDIIGQFAPSTRARTWTSSASLAWASTPPSWSPRRSAW